MCVCVVGLDEHSAWAVRHCVFLKQRPVCMLEECTVNYVIDVVPSFYMQQLHAPTLYLIIITDANNNTCMVYGVELHYGVLPKKTDRQLQHYLHTYLKNNSA